MDTHTNVISSDDRPEIRRKLNSNKVDPFKSTHLREQELLLSGYIRSVDISVPKDIEALLSSILSTFLIAVYDVITMLVLTKKEITQLVKDEGYVLTPFYDYINYSPEHRISFQMQISFAPEYIQPILWATFGKCYFDISLFVGLWVNDKPVIKRYIEMGNISHHYTPILNSIEPDDYFDSDDGDQQIAFEFRMQVIRSVYMPRDYGMALNIETLVRLDKTVKHRHTLTDEYKKMLLNCQQAGKIFQCEEFGVDDNWCCVYCPNDIFSEYDDYETKQGNLRFGICPLRLPAEVGEIDVRIVLKNLHYEIKEIIETTLTHETGCVSVGNICVWKSNTFRLDWLNTDQDLTFEAEIKVLGVRHCLWDIEMDETEWGSLQIM